MLIKNLDLLAIRADWLRHASHARFNVPVMSYGKSSDEIINFYREMMRRIEELPGVDHVSLGTSTPWRERRYLLAPAFSFTGEGKSRQRKRKDPRANFGPFRPVTRP